MIEVSNIKVPLTHLDGTHTTELNVVRKAMAKILGLKPQDLGQIELRKRSIDARKKNNIVLIFTARVRLIQGSAAEQKLLTAGPASKLKQVRLVSEPAQQVMQKMPGLRERPVVVGAGCAGLFCALTLAEAGYKPLLIERGDNATRRSEHINHFNDTGELDPESNIQFGLGGAGTFSDGKLATGTKSPHHRLILSALVKAGAPQEILWDAKPHVGSDLLPSIVENICARIQSLGGEVQFRTRLTELLIKDQKICGLRVMHSSANQEEHEQTITAQHVVLATGHSARDIFSMLKTSGVLLERKTFAMGVRIEHLQASIDRALFGQYAGHPALGAAPYKLVAHLASGRSAFSFCMCPGGYVVAAASEPFGVVTNGMSLSDRAGTNANSGLLANVFPTDLPGEDPLAGIALQRACELRAYELGEGNYVAPAQLVGDFLRKSPSTAQGSVTPTYPRGVRWGSLDTTLPPYIIETLRSAIPVMERHLHGFAASDAVLTGVETRSSSPVRVTRTKEGESISVGGLWPCGEGAGYAGGIMSAATDGIVIAQSVIAAQTQIC